VGAAAAVCPGPYPTASANGVGSVGGAMNDPFITIVVVVVSIVIGLIIGAWGSRQDRKRWGWDDE